MISSRLTRRQCLLGLAASVGASFVVACGASSPVVRPVQPSSETTAARATLTSAATVTSSPSASQLTFVRPSSGPAEDKAYQAMLSGWEKRHPEVKAVFSGVSYADYTQKFLTEIAGGVVRDVIGLTPGTMPVFAAKSAIIPLDAYVTGSRDLNKDDFFTAHWANGQYAGKQYSIPPDGSPLVIAYNVDLFTREGIKSPDSQWTWQDCLDTCQKLTKCNGNRVTQFGGSLTELFPWLFANDANVLRADTNKPTIDQPNAIAVLRFLGDLITTYHLNPTPQEQSELGTNLFLTGKVGMVIANRGTLGTAYRKAFFKIDVVPIPLSPATGHSGSQVTPLQMAIETPNPHKDLAWTLLEYLASAESQLTRFTQYGGYPSRRSVATDPKFLASVAPSWIGSEVNLKFAHVASATGTSFIPNHPRWAEINDVLNKHLSDLWAGKRPAEIVAKETAQEIGRVMS